jgi:ATP-dependent RNA helicase DDX55/SPB4
VCWQQHLVDYWFKQSLHAREGMQLCVQRMAVLKKFASCQAAALLCTDVAARGLDIPDVNYVLQFDPPQSSDTFVHRCGRTARMGRSGNALAMLLPNEDSYTELLRAQGVPLVEREPLTAPEPMAGHCRHLTESDRDVMEKGAKAFVSYIRGYKEHHCKFIFQLSELDFAGLARMFGLLRLPVMKEVRQRCCVLVHCNVQQRATSCSLGILCMHHCCGMEKHCC